MAEIDVSKFSKTGRLKWIVRAQQYLIKTQKVEATMRDLKHGNL
jgi:hypothetical protein